VKKLALSSAAALCEPRCLHIAVPGCKLQHWRLLSPWQTVFLDRHVQSWLQHLEAAVSDPATCCHEVSALLSIATQAHIWVVLCT
jgi:hypothetical protein